MHKFGVAPHHSPDTEYTSDRDSESLCQMLLFALCGGMRSVERLYLVLNVIVILYYIVKRPFYV